MRVTPFFAPVLESKNLSKPFWLRQIKSFSQGSIKALFLHLKFSSNSRWPPTPQFLSSDFPGNLGVQFQWVSRTGADVWWLGNKTKVGFLSLVPPFVRSESHNLWNQPKSFTVCDMSFDINQHPIWNIKSQVSHAWILTVKETLPSKGNTRSKAQADN